MFEYTFSPLIWNHLCLSFNYHKKHTDIFLNGLHLLNVTDPKLPTDNHPPKELFERLWLGKAAVQFDAQNSLVGKISDFNAWLRPLTMKEMLDWTECHVQGGGELLDWETTEWVF